MAPNENSKIYLGKCGNMFDKIRQNVWPHCAVFTGQWGNPDDNFLIVESWGNDDHGK